MNKLPLYVIALFGISGFVSGVDLVKDGAPVSEIVIAESAEPSVRTAAKSKTRKYELQFCWSSRL